MYKDSGMSHSGVFKKYETWHSSDRYTAKLFPNSYLFQGEWQNTRANQIVLLLSDKMIGFKGLFSSFQTRNLLYLRLKATRVTNIYVWLWQTKKLRERERERDANHDPIRSKVVFSPRVEWSCWDYSILFSFGWDLARPWSRPPGSVVGTSTLGLV